MAYVKKGGNGGWRPGAGGPRGPKQKTIDKIAARDAMAVVARTHAAAALAVLVEIMNDGGASGPARIAAARDILDRGHGRPAQALTDADGGKLLLPTTVVHVHRP